MVNRLQIENCPFPRLTEYAKSFECALSIAGGIKVLQTNVRISDCCTNPESV